MTNSIVERLLATAQYCLPHHALSRVIYWAARWRLKPWKNFLIRRAIAIFRIDLAEAVETDPHGYASFSAFFVRRLAEGSRPLCGNGEIASPCDGHISQIGQIHGNSLVQAKGRRFTVEELLGDGEDLAAHFAEGMFTTIYLSPRDYHRVHMPIDGILQHTKYVPGRLFSVAPYTTRHIPKLFSRNERLITVWETELGPMALVMVGALLVSGIETAWSGTETPCFDKRVRSWRFGAPGEKQVKIAKGEELGLFNMGSTVILLFGEDSIHWHASLYPDERVRQGESIAASHGTR